MCFRREKRLKINEAHDEARLEKAEREVSELKQRADRAIRLLEERHQRNHWSESIGLMIQGVWHDPR